jgi:hypothetical protein
MYADKYLVEHYPKWLRVSTAQAEAITKHGSPWTCPRETIFTDYAHSIRGHTYRIFYTKDNDMVIQNIVTETKRIVMHEEFLKYKCRMKK